MTRLIGAVATFAALLWCACFALPAASQAHPATLTAAEATVEADGRFRLVVQFDTLAFALNDTSARIGNAPMEELLASPRDALAATLAEAKGRFLHGFRVTTDQGPGSVDAIDFPSADQVLTWKATITPVLPVTLAVGLSGRLPPGAGTVAFRFPNVLEQVILTVERPDEEPSVEPVGAGVTSTVLPLKPAALSPSTPGPQAAPSSSPPGVPEVSARPDRHVRAVVYPLSICIALIAVLWIIRRAL